MVDESTRNDVQVSEEEAKPRLSRAKKLLLVLGVVFVLVGFGLSMTGADGAPPAGSGPDGANMLVPGATSQTAMGEPQEPDPWAPLLMKGGFSLLVGFAIGYAVRFFMKFTLLLAGIVALALFGLSYAGLLDVDWSVFQGHFEAIMPRVREGTSQFRAFLTSNLPSAGMGGFGLVAGFKR